MEELYSTVYVTLSISCARRYPQEKKEKRQTAVWKLKVKYISNSYSFLMCKTVLQCSHKPLGTDLISLVLNYA